MDYYPSNYLISHRAEAEMYYLSRVLQRMPWLKQITLNFDNCFEITDEGIEYLSEALKRQYHLEKFHLRITQYHKIFFQQKTHPFYF